MTSPIPSVSSCSLQRGSETNISSSSLSSLALYSSMCEANISMIDNRGTACSGQQNAVLVRHAFKQYGSKSKPNRVLTNLNMTVAKGTIYGLLGASGCGKTTLLSCIVGRRKLDFGEICVLGGKPGTKGSGVPGKRVGYMPQEIALYNEFTIKNSIMYFGWIFGMKESEILKRLKFLADFLDLPPQNRLIKNLSGGEQRRVSFAIALLHDPEVLILDEPTVGVDPLLRQRIWNHLVHITHSGQKTVILTTHYIEEARQAHTISLMRSGQLLAEASPADLLEKFCCKSLEEVFLKLSTNQETAKYSMNELNVNNFLEPAHLFDNKTDNGVIGLSFCQNKDVNGVDGSTMGRSNRFLLDSVQSKDNQRSINSNQVKINYDDLFNGDTMGCSNFAALGKFRALFQKNVLRMWRNLGIILFIFLLPVLQAILFCLTIGRTPTDLRLAIANMEMNDTIYCPFEKKCSFQNLSCRYLSHLNSTIIKEYYPNTESARQAVRDGHAWGAIYITGNFSNALVSRMLLGRDVNDETVDQSELQVWLDMSNQQIGFMLNRDLQLSYKAFLKALMHDCEQNPKLGEIPVHFNDPIYGSSTSTFTEFVAPGIIISIVYFFAVVLTSSALIIERTEGLLDRSWVAGVSSFEVVFSHIVVQFFVICLQTALVLGFMISVFGLTCNGSVFNVVILILLQGMCGMCFGFVISVSCDLEQHATQAALGSFYPLILLSGFLWPIEGMPSILRHVAKCLPLTQATAALRCILIRGWGIMEQEVYMGFISTVAWIVIFLAIIMVALRLNRS